MDEQRNWLKDRKTQIADRKVKQGDRQTRQESLWLTFVCRLCLPVCESGCAFIHVLSEQKAVSAFLSSKCNAVQKSPATLLVAIKQVY